MAKKKTTYPGAILGPKSSVQIVKFQLIIISDHYVQYNYSSGQCI